MEAIPQILRESPYSLFSQDTVSEQYQWPSSLAPYYRILPSHRGESASYPSCNAYEKHKPREEGQTRNKHTLYDLVNPEWKTNLHWQWGPLWQGHCQHYSKVLFRRDIAWVGMQENLSKVMDTQVYTQASFHLVVVYATMYTLHFNKTAETTGWPEGLGKDFE